MGEIFTLDSKLFWSGIGQLSLLILITTFVLFLFYKIIKSERELKKLNEFLTLIAITLILSVMLSYVIPGSDNTNLSSNQAYIQSWNQELEQERLVVSTNLDTNSLPDIYYIILDGYGREDILTSLYALDNTQFYDYLINQGFYIATESFANYSHTTLSLGSSLNFTYLNTLYNEDPNQYDVLAPSAMVLNNRVFLNLQSLGYQTVTFSNGSATIEMRNADKYFTPNTNINQFQQIMISNSILPVLFLEVQYGFHRAHIINTLEKLPQVDDPDIPQFIFAHIFAPHPPFVLDADGSAIYPDRPFEVYDGSDFIHLSSKEEYIQGYKNQLIYTTARIQVVIDQILTHSEQPPIIILQGDHGPGSELDRVNADLSNATERLAILNAYYFPNQEYANLYPGITPVNTFRVIFSQIFGADLELLPDNIFISSLNRVFAFKDVTEELNAALHNH
jgi:hypothetical protein